MSDDTTILDSALRAELGLSEDESLDSVLSVDPPVESVARGFMEAVSAENVQGLDRALLQQLHQSGTWTPLAEAAQAEDLPPSLQAAFRWGPDPRIVGFEQSATRWGGAAGLMDDGRAVLDPRGRLAWLAFSPPDDDLAEYVVAGQKGRIEFLRMAHPAVEVATVAEPRVDVPAPEALVEGFATAAWLMNLATTLHASADLSERVASVGLLARYAALAATDASQWTAAMLERFATPSSRMLAWAKAELSTEALDELESCFVFRCGDLALDLEDLPEFLSEDLDKDTLALVVRSIYRRRDELESIHAVLQACGRSEIREHLEGLDELATTLLSTFDLANEMTTDGIYDEHLEMAAVETDAAWWGPDLS